MPVIPSVPGSFTVGDLLPSVNLTFAIPKGKFKSGVWAILASFPFSGHVVSLGMAGGGFGFLKGGSASVPATAAELAAINAAAGGNFPVIADGDGQGTNVTALTLTLTPQSAAGKKAKHSERIIEMLDARCVEALPAIWQNLSVDGLTFPCGFQIYRAGVQCDYLSIVPGLCNWNGNEQNSSLGIRIYDQPIGGQKEQIVQAGYDTRGVRPVHTQLADTPILIPWRKPIVLFVEFVSVSTPAPSDSNIEFCIEPLNLR